VPQKILIATFGFHPQQHGVAQAAYQQALGLYQLGYKVTVVTQGEASSTLPFEVVCIKQKSDYQSFLKASDAKVIFFHGWHNWVSDWAYGAMPLKAKTVLISHGTNFNLRLEGWKGWLRWFFNQSQSVFFTRKLTRFDHLVFLSTKPDPKRMSDVILARKKELRNYSIIPNGARPAFLKECAVDFKATHAISASKMLLCVSNFQPSKGQRELLNWFIDLNLTDTALVLIGSKFNDFSEELKEQAADQLNKRIFFFEKQTEEELHSAYTAASLFLSATYTEVQPLMLLDAMAVGLPFVCRDVGVVSELNGGICFKTAEEFKENVPWLLKSPFLCQQLGILGKKAVKERYNWETTVRQYHFLIQ
jgi:glycosyltransferase involved in cell wall biosynthesis